MRFRDLSLKTKQLIAFGLVLIVLLIASGFVLHRMSNLKDSFDEVATNWMPRGVAIAELSRGIGNYRALALQHTLTESPFEKKSLEKLINLQIEQIQDYLDQYEKLRDRSRESGLYSGAEDSLYESFDADWDAYQSVFQQWYISSLEMADAAEGSIVPGQGADQLITGEGAILHDNIRWTLEGLVENINFEAQEAATSAEQLLRTTRQGLAILFAISIGLSAVIALAMTRIIANRLKKLADATETVSQGNLDIKLDISGKDEVGSLAQSFDRMANSLLEARGKMEQQAERLREQNSELEITLKRLNETQEELLLKEKMASLGKLVASVAHEINSPIGTVISAADVSERALLKLKESIDSRLPKKMIEEDENLARSLAALRENTALTITASRRIADIVQNLKSFSRLDESEYQSVDIHKGIESSLVLLGEKKLSRIEVMKKYGKLPNIICNPGLLNQVFMNIISNAVNAIKDSGTITIETYQKNGEVVVDISDSGMGIPRERLKTLFDFGFSTDTKRVKMGTGLLTAYNVVQKHRGRIEVTSEVGLGSTFSIILPVAIVK
jgi:signal transduction histidine kinase